MTEWQSVIKIGLAGLLVMGLIVVGITFFVSGEIVKEITEDKVNIVPNFIDDIYSFNGKYLDKESAFNFACNCIDKSVVLKINSINSGIKQVDLTSSKVRKNIESLVDRDRFKIIVTEDLGMVTITMEG